MGIFDRIKKVFQPDEQVVTKHWNGLGSRTVTGINHPIAQMLKKCWDAEIQDPREKILLNRLLIDSLPFFKRAVSMQADLIGTVGIETENPKLRKLLEDFEKSIRIRFQDNPEFGFNFGMSNYARMLVRVALTDGMAFSESRVNEDTGIMDGVLVCKSENFRFVFENRKAVLKFYVPNEGTQIEIKESDNFHIFGINFMPGSLWGLSMVDGGAFLSEILINMLIARKNNYVRLGSPPGLNIFTLEDSTGFTGNDFAKFSALIKEGEERMMEAIHASEKGQSSEVFMKLGGKINFDHKMYGNGTSGMQGFAEDFMLLMKVLAHLTGIPVELWIESSAVGIGSDKFDILKGMLTASTGAIREMLKPILKKIFIGYLVSVKAPAQWIDQFEIRFTDLDIVDKRKIAESDEARAKAIALHLENASKLWMELGLPIEEVNQYFVEAGMPWIQLTDLPDPVPTPEPEEGEE